MNPTNELFHCIWEVIEPNLQENKKIESAERMFKIFEDFGALSEELRELGDEDKFLAQASELAFADEFEDENEYSYEEEEDY